MPRPDDNGWIVTPAERVPSPHVYRNRKARGFPKPMVAVLLILHYAVDGDQSTDDNLDYNFVPRERSHDCMDVARGFQKPGRDASTHFVIGRDGSKAQCVKLTDACWGAGDSGLSRFPDQPPASLDATPFRARYVNLISTQIELCNVGWAVDSFKIPKGERVLAKHPAHNRAKQWEVFTFAQYSTLEYMAAQLRINQPTLRLVCGHEDVTNRHTIGKIGGKTDPGPAFMWDRVDWRGLGYTPIMYSFADRAWIERPLQITV